MPVNEPTVNACSLVVKVKAKLHQNFTTQSLKAAKHQKKYNVKSLEAKFGASISKSYPPAVIDNDN